MFFQSRHLLLSSLRELVLVGMPDQPFPGLRLGRQDIFVLFEQRQVLA